MFVAFAVWWALLWLLFTLGTCGEDSDLQDPEDYDRLCGDQSGWWLDGTLFDTLVLIGAAATAVTALLTAIAVRRRAWWPLGALALALVLAGALGLSAEPR
jgi:hypothetical protein